MNVLKPHLKATIRTLLGKGISHRQINRKTGVDRKTIRKYDRLDSLPSSQEGFFPPKSPTTQEVATGIEDRISPKSPTPATGSGEETAKARS